MVMEEHEKKAFDFAADYSKQLITLATAVITFMVTFLQDVFSRPDFWQKVILLTSWVFYLLSIGCGVWKQMALTGNLAPVSGTPSFNINTCNIRIPAICQIITFLVAVILTCIFGSERIFDGYSASPVKKSGIVVIQEKGSEKQVVVKPDTIWIK